MIVLCRKLIFKFEHLHLEVASFFILFREHLLSSSLYCKLCTLKHHRRLFLSIATTYLVAVLRNMYNFVRSQLLYFIKLLVTHCSLSFLVHFGIDNYFNN